MTAAEAGDTPILEQLLREREDREWFPPVSGDLNDEAPTVEFRPLRLRGRRLAAWVRRRMTWQRGTAAAVSGLVLLVSFLGWWHQ